MPLFALGINHQTASVALRERIAFSSESLTVAYQELYQAKIVLEAVIISTCNRTEIYCHVEQLDCQEIIEWLCKFHDLDREILMPSLYCYQDKEAIGHLFRVACGLDSLVLGEPQILGQIKQAFMRATQEKSSAKIINRLFQQTFSVAKKIRTDTQIGANAVSVAFAAVCLTKQIFENLTKSKILLVGAGETIELVGKYLVDHQVPNITIANRTLSNAHALVEKLNAKIITLEEIPSHLADADVVISSTASPLPIIGKGMVESALKIRRNKPMLFIDIAVPRDIEHEVEGLNNVYLYTVDDLHGIIEENKLAREEAAIEAEKIVKNSVGDFISWLESLKAEGCIKRYRSRSEEMRDTLLQQSLAELSKNEAPETVLKTLAFKLTNKLIHHPSKGLSTVSKEGTQQELELLQSVLGLDSDK